MPGDPMHQSNGQSIDRLTVLEQRVTAYSTNQWKGVVEKDIDNESLDSTFIASCVDQIHQTEQNENDSEESIDESIIAKLRLLRAIHALMVDPELSFTVTRWLFLAIKCPSADSESADRPGSFIDWLLQSISIEISSECLIELFSVLILCCQSISHSNERFIEESIKSLSNDVLQDACFTCLIISHSRNQSIGDLAAIVLLILERFNRINQSNNHSINQSNDQSNESVKSLLLSMIQPSSIHLILHEAAHEAHQSLEMSDHSVDEFRHSDVLTPVINQSIHCLNTGTIDESINQMINPCYEASNNQPANEFFVIAPLNLIHSIISTNQFSLIYSNDLLVLADILAQLIEDRAGDDQSVSQSIDQSLNDEDVCAIALDCLLRLIDGWPDLKQRSSSKRERFARAARVSEESIHNTSINQSIKSDRHIVARRLSEVIDQWTNEAEV